jgi:hypothetical protein
VKELIYNLVLEPLILRDLRLREQGRRPDRWYWADRLAVRWGFLTDPATGISGNCR